MVKIRKSKKNTNGSTAVKYWALMGLFLLLLIQTPNAAAEPPIQENECLIYAYTESDVHYFLLESNKSAFGTNMTIKHNCEYIEVFINGTFSAYTEQEIIQFPLQVGINNIEIFTENYSKRIDSVFIYPDRLSWQFEYDEWRNTNDDYSFDEFILRSKATAAENWASILSIVMVFTLTTMVYWNLINSYVDRNFCEEVKE